MNKKEISAELKNRLDEFQVDVPEIPHKSSAFGRIANWIFAPAKDPLELFGVKGNSISKLVFYPFVFLFVLCFMPIILS